MNVSKTLAAAIAATTIVGAVGLAYAQTTSDTPASPAYPASSGNASAAPAAPADPKPAMITPAETQKAAAQDPSMKAPVEGSQGTQSGPTPSTDKSLSVTPTPAPAANDSPMASEPRPKADRN